MSLKHGLLGLLDYGPMSGYELCRVFEESLAFFWQATTSQVYRELAAMEQAGLLGSEQVVQTGKPNKRLYSLTDSGRRELVSWLERPLAPKDLETKNSFLMKIFFSSRGSLSATVENLRRFREMNARSLELLESGGSGEAYEAEVEDPCAPRCWKLTADFGRSYYRMCVAWAESSIRELEEDRA